MKFKPIRKSMAIQVPNLYLGDCLEKMTLIPDKSIDMVLCDLPYGTTACKWDVVIPFEPLWEQYQRIVTPNAAIVLTANNPFSSLVVCSNLKNFKYSWVWEKNRPTLPHHSKNRPMGKHEDILVFSYGKMGHTSQLGDSRMTYNPQGISTAGNKIVTAKGSHSRITGPRPNQVGKKYEAKTGFPHTLLRFNKDESHFHPTQKPIALLEYLILTYTHASATVLDNCMGSGSTGVACQNTRRKFIGIEKDPSYFAIAKKRLGVS